MTLLQTLGCRSTHSSQEKNVKSKANITGVKLADLAPTGQIQSESKLNTSNFDLYIYQIPKHSVSQLDLLWSKLFRTPLRFENSAAFSANSFVAGVSEYVMWAEVKKILDDLNAIRKEKVTLLIQDGASQIVRVRHMNKQKIHYRANNGKYETANTERGILTIQLKASKSIGKRGFCDVHFEPIYKAYNTKRFKLSGKKQSEIRFRAASFKLSMRPGQFFIVGPSHCMENDITLGQMFFGTDNKTATMKLYMVVCTGVYLQD
jgi:hypothetical protein